jgi:hypothetical protein
VLSLLFKLYGLPDTTENGAATLAVPDRVPPPVFCTVNVRSAVVPTWMHPKSSVGGVTAITGRAYAEPLTGRVASPPPVKLTLALSVPSAAGLYRTTTSALWPAPILYGLPDTMLNGAVTLALPDKVPPPVFSTVKVRSAVVPTSIEPKS